MSLPSRPPQAQRLIASACALAALALGSTAAMASSHREAPGIAQMPAVDATDLYMFRSYAAGRANFVTILANYIPLQDPAGGPNFFMFDDQALYEIHIDNNGDAKEDISFKFRFTNTSKGQALTIGTKSVQIPLINKGVISDVNDADLNVRETFTVDVARAGRRNNASNNSGAVTNAAGGAREFDKPVDNIGQKSIPDYAGYAAKHMYSVNIPGCTTAANMFVGQRKEPFYIAVGKLLDLINLDPLNPNQINGNANNLEKKSVTTIALEVPITCLTQGTEPVIGAWTTASKRQGRLLNPAPGKGLGKTSAEGGAWTQVSRLGMPLVNEVVIGLDDKDRFNASKPQNDAQFLDYVTNPTLPALIQTLFPIAPAPTNFPRTDLVTVFLKGLEGLNQPANVVASEMLRLNTTTPPNTGVQNPLGVAGGDNAGFPNGRRPADDVTDVSLRVAMGALCVLTGTADSLKVGCKPSDAPAGGAALTDGVRKTSADYPAVFPYLATPTPGNVD